jgi:HSP20 family protein
MLLSQNDPFRDLDQMFRRMAGRNDDINGMAMDAYRRGSNVWVHIDLPGVSTDAVDISVERSVLTIEAQRDWERKEGDQMYLLERPRGRFRRQVHLGESLDPEGIEATFNDGVLTLRIPISERAKPRKITIGTEPSAIEAESIDVGTESDADEVKAGV